VTATSAAMKGSVDPSYGKHLGTTGVVGRGCFPEGYNDGQLNRKEVDGGCAADVASQQGASNPKLQGKHTERRSG